MWRALAVALTGVVLSAAPLRAEEHKCPTPGLSVRYSGGDVIRYESQEGLWCLRTRNGKPATSELGHVAWYFRDRASGDEYEKWLKAVVQFWPISPGKTITFTYLGTEDGSGPGAAFNRFFYAHDVTVEPPRQVTVGAGTFTVFPIVDIVRGTGGNHFRSSYTHFYAPELGTDVKFEFKLISGSIARQPSNWEIVAIIPPR